MSTKLSTKELGEKLAAKRAELNGVFKEATVEGSNGELDLTQVKSIAGGVDVVLEEIKTRRLEIEDLEKDYQTRADLLELQQKNRDAMTKMSQPVNGARPSGKDSDDEGRLVKTMDDIAREFLESEGYAHAKRAGFKGTPISFKADGLIASKRIADRESKAMTTSSGYAQEVNRTGRNVFIGVEQPSLLDYITVTTTTQDTIYWMLETTETDNTAPVAEGAAMTESVIAFTEQSSPTRSVGTYLTVTEQQMENGEQVESLIGMRLPLLYDAKIDQQFISGNGSGQNLTGIYSNGDIQNHAKGSDSIPDAIYKSIDKVRTTNDFAEPNLVIIHPTDWQKVRLLKDNNGNYIWGSPADPSVDRIWGKAVYQTSRATLGSSLTGDFSIASIEGWLRRAAEIVVGLTSDDFVKNQLTMKILGRMALTVYRPKAFCTTTGL